MGFDKRGTSMSKELEALERIKRFYPQWRLSNRNDFNIIETALKKNEYLKTELLGQSQELNFKNKVLEIIIKKEVDVHQLSYFINALYDKEALESYNEEVFYAKRQLTQEEFDSVKKVLL